MKIRTGIIIGILAAAAAGGGWVWKCGLPSWQKTDETQESSYLVSVAELSAQPAALGAVNRFSGVVEAQKTWSVDQNPDSTVKEILVSVGDEVKAGDPLFIYDIEKYQSDQEQAEIELERMNNELESIKETIEKLQVEQARATASEQADYTIRVQDAELQKKQKELDIRSKNLTISRLKDSQINDTVVSEIDGVVRSINNGSGYDLSGDGEDIGFITIMQTDDLRIKGTVNEQNIGRLSIDSPVIVRSRVDDTVWQGRVTEINTDNTVNNESMSNFGGSNYYFYVELEDISGLIIGQHVYIEPDIGQLQSGRRYGIWIPLWYVAEDESGNPYVLAETEAGRTERREVETGEIDTERMMIQICNGISEKDRIAIPEVNADEEWKDEVLTESELSAVYDEIDWDGSLADSDWDE